MKYTEPVPGTFGYDLAFLNLHKRTVVLSDSKNKAQLVIIPGWQARVMTSTANGPEGFSYGWLNYKLIESGKHSGHMNAYGGEERIWLGPEGGPFSIYFAQGVSQEFDNWYVPAELDTSQFEVISVSQAKAEFSKKFTLQNYSGTQFEIGIQRTVRMLGNDEIDSLLGLHVPDSVRSMGYESDNRLINRGNMEWSRKTGMLSVWMLSMFKPSPGVTTFIPYKDSADIPDERIVNDDYFGKIPSDRLHISNGLIWFKADGKLRSKLGIPPHRAMNYAASYDSHNEVLTIIWSELPEVTSVYVNSKWGDQDDPFSGDVINAYNDGPVEDGSQMGPFYELESSSPAANLRPGESIVHRQRIFHFEGNDDGLSIITKNLFGVSISQIKESFNGPGNF